MSCQLNSWPQVIRLLLALFRKIRLFLQAASCPARHWSIDLGVLDANPKSAFFLQVESLLYFPHLMRKCQGVDKQGVSLRRRIALAFGCLGGCFAGFGRCMRKDAVWAGSDESICSGRPSSFGLGVVLALNERKVNERIGFET